MWLAWIAVFIDCAAAAPIRLGLRQISSPGDENHTSGKALLRQHAASLKPADHSEVPPVWAPEEASLPKLDDDSMLSSPSLLTFMVKRQAAAILASRGTNTTSVHRPPKSLLAQLQGDWATYVTGAAVFILGLLIHWFNELRSVKMDTLLSRGLSECESIDAFKITDETIGCLVHVQGNTKAEASVTDLQFKDASVRNVLKLQSTVEVFEWVQTMKIPHSRSTQDGSQRLQYAFHKEWSTIHRNSAQFQSTVAKPSPDNPRLPRGLSLGTFTSVCKHVSLGAFKLPEDMVSTFTKFEPAQRYLPPTVTAHGMQFFANKDGYFYARPSQRSILGTRKVGLGEPVVGDVRVRFMCVPQGTATVVAVHCEKAGTSTFLPYRPIPRGCCLTTYQERVRLLEEGSRSLPELRETSSDMLPCLSSNRLLASCFCCPCSTIQSVCSKEVVTEEIYHVSEELDPIEKPFEGVVSRNQCRVCIFRAIGWLICYLSAYSITGTLVGQDFKGLSFYGSWAPAVFAAILATAASALVISIAYMPYRPVQSFKWACAVALVIVVPYVLGPLVASH
jgi:hypothetical protein